MAYTNIAEQITGSLTMFDLLLHYGFQLNNKRAMLCPFHNEKTPSFVVYAEGRKWKCFGCGEGGSVIDFVRKMFGMDFRSAVFKLNYDFNLGLEINGRKPSFRERQIAARMTAERKAAADELQKEKEKLNAEYWALIDMWEMWDGVKKGYAPTNDTETLNPIFVRALEKIAQTEYEIDIVESKILKWGDENRK